MAGGSSDNGTNIQQWDCIQGEENQNWRLAEGVDKFVKITSKKTGKVMDAGGGNVHQWEYLGNLNQWFIMALMEAGTQNEYYKIIADNSGECVDVTGASKDDGANIQLSTCADVDNQKYTLEAGADGYAKIIAKHSGKCLDLAGGGSDDGVNIQQYECVGSGDVSADNQLWKIEKL